MTTLFSALEFNFRSLGANAAHLLLSTGRIRSWVGEIRFEFAYSEAHLLENRVGRFQAVVVEISIENFFGGRVDWKS